MLKDVGLVILGALVGALASYWLFKHPARLDKDRTLILGLVDSLRALLPPIATSVERGYLFPNDLTPVKKLLKESETQASYLNLPSKTTRRIDEALTNLEQFSQAFVQVKDLIFPFFEKLQQPHGGGMATEMVATDLICLQEWEVPATPLKVNFPRKFSGHVAQANLTADQVRALWKFGQDHAQLAELRAVRSRAKESLEALNPILLDYSNDRKTLTSAPARPFAGQPSLRSGRPANVGL